MTLPSHHYRNDLWTLADDFGLGHAGDQVARMALEVEAPFALGVIGKWGAGKTSVLRRAFVTLGGQPLQQKLMLAEPGEEEWGKDWKTIAWSERKEALGWSEDYYDWLDGVLCVWYSPWQHQNEPNPLIPLIREIKAQFEVQRLTLPERLRRRGLEVAQNLNRRGGLAVAKLLETVTDAAASLVTGRPIKVVGGLAEGMQKAWREAETDLLAPSDGQRFHLLFEDAVNEVLASVREGFDEKSTERSRLVLFIDDLDRCEEGMIVRLLESIKLYLSSKRCVFVLGLDNGAVLDALHRHWEDRSDDSNREYLEKLFQATLAVPLPASRKVKEAVARQLKRHNIRHSLANRMAQDIQELLEPNPRKVKNFTNSLCAAWGLYKADTWAGKNETKARRFVLFHYLRQFHRSVWRLIEHQPEALHLLWAVLSNAEDGDINKDLFPGRFEEQRLLMEIFYRAFSHVLKTTSPDEKTRHGNESLEQAVKSFEERRDRKRSDEQFCMLFCKQVDKDTKLDPRYLSLENT